MIIIHVIDGQLCVIMAIVVNFVNISVKEHTFRANTALLQPDWKSLYSSNTLDRHNYRASTETFLYNLCN